MQPLVKSTCTKKLKDRVMENGLLQKTSFQLLLPTQAIPRLALAKVITAMLVKGSPSTYPASKAFPPHTCFWSLLEIRPGYMNLQCDSLQVHIRVLTFNGVHFYMLPDTLKYILLQISLFFLLEVLALKFTKKNYCSMN